MAELERHVYIVGADRAGPLKVGVAANPQARCRELQTGHPSVLSIFWTYGPWPSAIALRMERVIHRILAPRRAAKGEWFHVPIEAAMAALWIAEHNIPQFDDPLAEPATDEQLAEWAAHVGLRF